MRTYNTIYTKTPCIINSQVNGLPFRNDEFEQATADILHVYLLVCRHRSDRRRIRHQTMGRGVGPTDVQHHRVCGSSQSRAVSRRQVLEYRLRTPDVQRRRWVLYEFIGYIKYNAVHCRFNYYMINLYYVKRYVDGIVVSC